MTEQVPSPLVTASPVTSRKRMPPQRTPPRKPSHRSRNISIAVIAVFALLAAIGSASSRTDLVMGSTAPPDAVASDESAPGPDSSDDASPTPGATTLVTIKGTGPLTSDAFQASGTSVEVAYTYTCPADDNFTLNFYGTNGSPVLADVLVTDYGTTGSDAVNEQLKGTTGPFTIEIDSPCDWTVKITGTP